MADVVIWGSIFGVMHDKAIKDSKLIMIYHYAIHNT